MPSAFGTRSRTALPNMISCAATSPTNIRSGCVERKIHCTVLETRNGRNLGDRIDPRGIPDILEAATASPEGTDGRCGVRLPAHLEVQPKHADTLHRLGQLLAVKGNHAEAKRLFRTLTMVRPDAAKAWQRVSAEPPGCAGSRTQHPRSVLFWCKAVAASRMSGSTARINPVAEEMPRSWPRRSVRWIFALPHIGTNICRARCRAENHIR